MADLLELATRVESGENNRSFCEEIHIAMCWGAENENLPKALGGCLTSALNMLAVALPGWEWKYDSRSGRATVRPKDSIFAWVDGYSDSPSDALVAAILRAKAGMD